MRAARSWATVSYSLPAQPAGFLPKQVSFSAFCAATAPATSTEPCLESTFLPFAPRKKREKVVTALSSTVPPARVRARSASSVSLSSQKIRFFSPCGSAPRNAVSSVTVGARYSFTVLPFSMFFRQSPRLFPPRVSIVTQIPLFLKNFHPICFYNRPNLWYTVCTRRTKRRAIRPKTKRFFHET